MTINDICPWRQATKLMCDGASQHLLKNGHRVDVIMKSNQLEYNGVKARLVAVSGLISKVKETRNYIEEIEEQNKKLMDIAWMQSHMIRSPLTRIMALVELLSFPEVDSETKELLTYLSMAADELDQVIRNIISSTGRFKEHDH